MGQINYEKSLERYKERLKKSRQVSDRNREIILKFIDKSVAMGSRSTQRIVKYAWILMKLSSMIDFDFDKATRDKMEDLVLELRKSDAREWTKRDYLLTIKCFYKDMFGQDGDYPPVVKFIRTHLSNEFRKEQPKRKGKTRTK